VDLWDILSKRLFGGPEEGRRHGVIKYYIQKIVSICMKLLLYPLLILAKKGALIQLYALKNEAR
jgi:hypothetical protein